MFLNRYNKAAALKNLASYQIQSKSYFQAIGEPSFMNTKVYFMNQKSNQKV
ncbi:hypothetical protein [Mycoplasma sp. ATU-Cv-508]|uniref:hypothetical protein n=1 Tax=Mycoplasma sp. ATU-Cv-508 TaxID=2048001 RepID=UPI0013749827